jgi:hypothetical protein
MGNREVFCGWAQKRHGWTVNPEDVVICQGMLTSIAMMVETLTAPGDGVIVPMPAYQPFVRIVNNLERKLVRWPLLYDGNTHKFSLDWTVLDHLCEKAKLLIFCNPHNPSGVDFPESDLTTLCCHRGTAPYDDHLRRNPWGSRLRDPRSVTESRRKNRSPRRYVYGTFKDVQHRRRTFFRRGHT